jgi:hypothetical protein
VEGWWELVVFSQDPATEQNRCSTWHPGIGVVLGIHDLCYWISLSQRMIQDGE